MQLNPRQEARTKAFFLNISTKIFIYFQKVLLFPQIVIADWQRLLLAFRFGAVGHGQGGEKEQEEHAEEGGEEEAALEHQEREGQSRARRGGNGERREEKLEREREREKEQLLSLYGFCSPRHAAVTCKQKRVQKERLKRRRDGTKKNAQLNAKPTSARSVFAVVRQVTLAFSMLRCVGAFPSARWRLGGKYDFKKIVSI